MGVLRARPHGDARLVKDGVVDHHVGQPQRIHLGQIQPFSHQIAMTVHPLSLRAGPPLITMGAPTHRRVFVYIEPNPEVPEDLSYPRP